MDCKYCGGDDEDDVHAVFHSGRTYLQCPDEDRLVACDQACRALVDPKTPEEVQAAYEHWRRHRYLGGCSHGG